MQVIIKGIVQINLPKMSNSENPRELARERKLSSSEEELNQDNQAILASAAQPEGCSPGQVWNPETRECEPIRTRKNGSIPTGDDPPEM
jgi:hypothetical protein